MKLFNKLISAMCAVGIVATMASSLVLVHAAELPKLELDVQWTDEEAGTGTITASVSGLQLPDVSGAEYAYLAAWQMNLGVDGDVFDTSLWATTAKMRTNLKPLTVSTKGSLTRGSYLSATKTIQPNWYIGDDAFWDLVDLNLADISKIGDKLDLFTLNFKVANKTKLPTTITLANIELRVNAMDADGNLLGYRLFGNATKDDEAMTIVDSTKFPATTEPVEPDKPTVPDAPAEGGVSGFLNVKPADVSAAGNGNVFTSEDGSEAVAALANFSNISGKMKWTISYTDKVASATKTAYKEIPVANLEGYSTIGMIINYDPANYGDVTFTGVTVE